MKIEAANKNIDFPVRLSFLYLFSGWTIVIIIILLWSYFQIKEETHRLAYKEAKKSYEKDLIVRMWATMHGGVYVPVTAETRPNKYLNTENRDVTFPDDKLYTLMNPAYLTRQLNEFSRSEFNIISNITSLNPIRPENKADKWEIKALKSFDRGAAEYFSIDTISDVEYFRYMAPLVTKKGCLKCHQQQGYKIGDIRGGLSTAIPWSKYSQSASLQFKSSLLGYGLIWLLGMTGLFLVKRKFVFYVLEKTKADELKNNLINQLEETKIKLEHSNATKDKFFSIIAHDLKSPFQGFIGLTSLIADEMETFSKQEILNYVGNINKKAENLHKLLQNLLDWARLQRGKFELNPQILDLSESIKKTLVSLKDVALNKEITLKYLNSAPVYVMADENMLDSVLRNLISNAIKFSFRKKDIIIDYEVSEELFVIIKVQDFGTGMDQEKINKLFKIDEKTGTPGTEGEESTGLGLILCKEFVDLNKGKIWVESSLNKGSIFYFTLMLMKR